MAHSRIVVMGASAGGIEAVTAVLRALPNGFPATVLVVIHTGPAGLLPMVFSRASALPVSIALDGQPLEPGQVFIAPPDRHLTVKDGVVTVAKGPREHGFRPAVDPLFLSAARAAGDRVAGVVLSGALSDGTIGLGAIKQAGGLTVVQHPDEAPFPSMPLSALRTVVVDAVLPVSEIGGELTEWAMNGTRRGPKPAVDAAGKTAGQAGRGSDEASPQLMAFTCPSCGGAISEAQELGITHYECHVGHRFDGESLIALGDERTENTLWKASRALQEQALLRRRMITRAEERGLASLAAAWRAEAEDAEARADEIRSLIEGMPAATSAQLVDAGGMRNAGDGGRRGTGKGDGEGRADTPATRQQARASRQLHQAAREKRRPRPSNGRSRSTGRTRG